MDSVDLNKGEVLYYQGDPTKEMFIITRGAVTRKVVVEEREHELLTTTSLRARLKSDPGNTDGRSFIGLAVSCDGKDFSAMAELTPTIGNKGRTHDQPGTYMGV